MERDAINRLVNDAHDRLFEQIENRRGKSTPPSEIVKLLDADHWGLGDEYREWWLESGEDWT